MRTVAHAAERARAPIAGFLAVWAAWSLLDQTLLSRYHPLAEIMLLIVAAAVAAPWSWACRATYNTTVGAIHSQCDQTLERL